MEGRSLGMVLWQGFVFIMVVCIVQICGSLLERYFTVILQMGLFPKSM